MDRPACPLGGDHQGRALGEVVGDVIVEPLALTRRVGAADDVGLPLFVLDNLVGGVIEEIGALRAGDLQLAARGVAINGADP